MVQMGRESRDKDNSNGSLTLTDQPSVLSISMETVRNSDSTTVQDSHWDTVSFDSFYTAKSFDELEMQDKCQSSPPPGILLTVRPASVPPHFPGGPESMMPVHASRSVETV